jgi:hypothetical protein
MSLSRIRAAALAFTRASLAIASLAGCGAVVSPLGDGGTDRVAPRDGAVDPCAPWDARGVGACAAAFGPTWNGSACVYIGGCSCVGADCARLSEANCQATLARCSTTPPPPPIDAGPSECTSAVPSRVLAPQLLFSGQPLGLTVESASSGCACTPTLAPNGLSSARGYDLQLCGCCRDCDCIDPAYRVSTLLGAPAAPSTTVAVTGDPMARRTVHVLRDTTACESNHVMVSNVTVEAPGTQRASGPALYWLTVRGTHRPCCNGAVGFVDAVRGQEITLEPRSCQTTLCDGCVPVAMRREVAFETSHLLGELRPGDYRATVGTFTVTFSVPR